MKISDCKMISIKLGQLIKIKFHKTLRDFMNWKNKSLMTLGF